MSGRSEATGINEAGDAGDPGRGAGRHAASAAALPGACSGSEVFALRVLGTDMAPEFNDGDIVVIEPGGAVRDGCYVLAQVGDEWILRQLRRERTAWVLRALDERCALLNGHALPDDLSPVRGVVIQKAVPGRRRLSRSYL